ncbi:LysR family transcriptional regulator [Rhizobium mongolense]|uniref:HTH-type transcriptional regulator TtuA n=1 Tax=Rhizobium mongolense TaxID=57676 RepID=A0A7W6RTI3_9HYPH|nr:LysR family transcriptional regulator [Rhizobium mongolense]MBB4278369.1 DNA-binding transcriptional LysR family regulator [Rhizobium mongolense]
MISKNRSAEMEVFVRVIEAGSLSEAGRQLGLSPSAVSKLISRLETRLGVRLLARTARALTPTSEGEAYYDRSLQILADMDEAERAASQAAIPTGRLRVNASLVLGNHLLVPLLPEFFGRYPQILLDLTFTDDVIDIVEERADVAIRLGPLTNSGLKTRKLGESRRYVVAAPSYLARHGVPDTPQELADHNCLGFNFRRTLSPWRFAEDTVQRPLAGSAEVNNGETLRQLVLAGVGLGRLAAFHVGEDIVAGRLVRVLTDYDPRDPEEVHAVFVDKRHMSGRLRAFIDFLVEQVTPALSAVPDKSVSP